MEQTGQESGQRVSLPNNAEMLHTKIRLSMNALMRNYLFIVEELVDDHDVAMGKLMDALPADLRQYVILADYLNEARMETMRKRVLSLGNNVARDLEQTIDALRLDGRGQ